MATHLEGPIILAAVATGVIAGGQAGPLAFSMSDFGWATAFAAIGMIGREFLDAKDERDKAIAAGLPPHPLDYVSLAYGLFSCPLVGGISLALSHATGFVPDYAAAPIIMGIGYLGRDGVNLALNIIRAIISKVQP